ncbi:HAD family hydrolase [Clostridium sporogenes]|uniref:HAD family hydrolase n=2 Tax=Clostridium TaxID=1485 RepID=A0AAE4Z2U2_CLOSG|nr:MULTISPECIES: Cof-type HAD-IIB family hydrolase [Clostridium]EKS4344323.1 HAD family hydrolase [Clostridium botulinum]MBE6076680.1 HAD family hydrolase [Clostridium lundense]EKS4394201.1 HAD family hydrolase [Clostridium botulinum]KIS23161.1 HAD family hydrolase [Clostridium botulinum B2 450]MCW6080031.1 Cof-type HAD-IIB family hydrolase [Clostridium sporogenes]
MIKFIATDLDGTLVNSEGKIYNKVFNLINDLHKNGVRFAAASGRFYSQLNENFNSVKEDMILIAHNGALIKYSKNGQTLYANYIDKEYIKSVEKLKRNFGEELILGGENEAFVVNPSESIKKEFSFYNVPYIEYKSFDEVDKPVQKISYYVKDGIKAPMLDYLKENLNKNLQFVASGDKWIDMMNKEVSKGHAIKILQKKFNIEKDNTMVFGDYYNDITMFKQAYYSYAMENAPEDVKEKANFIAGNNNENAVYKTISKHMGFI